MNFKTRHISGYRDLQTLTDQTVKHGRFTVKLKFKILQNALCGKKKVYLLVINEELSY